MKNNAVSVRSLLGVLMAFMLMMVVFESCKKEDNPAVISADKTKLNARLDSANAGYALAVEGAQVGQFETGSKAAFKTLIDAATTVKNNANATQADVNNAYAQLGAAGALFLSKRVQEIAPTNLVLYLKMDGDTKDASGKGLDGSLKAGPTKWGRPSGTPTLTKDRYGNANKAYYFGKGGNIEVPYNSVLNPAKEISVSIWARMDSIRADNYMVGLARWYGYKLNLQDKPVNFMTMNTDKGIFDRDEAAVELEVNKWYHFVVTYKAGEMKFFRNGTLTKSWTDVAGDPIAVKSNINLVIGQDLPTSLYTDDESKNADGQQFYGKWGGYFRGDLDDVRIYNIVLSDTQVKSLYTAEKP